MSSTAVELPADTRGTTARIVRAGLLTAVSDALFSSVLVVFFYAGTFARLWQGVASVLLGKSALDGGSTAVAIGLLMHVGVAFGWTMVFVLILMRMSWVRRLLGSRGGPFKVALWYGPLIWLMMSCVIIPALTHRPPAINLRWWVQFFGHIPFVALPIAWGARR